MACDPTTMLDDAGCLAGCIPPAKHPTIQTYLLALINGGSMDPAELLRSAVRFSGLPASAHAGLQAYLLCQILGTGNCTAQELAAAARCYKCIPPAIKAAVQTYMICKWSEGGQGVCDHPVVLDWLARMAADFIPRPSDATIRAVCDFCEELDAVGIMDKMLVVNPIIPDSFLAMRYPLIYQAGNGYSPFINHNFVAADLDGNGIAGDALTKYFDTGFVPNAHWADTISGGLTAYTNSLELGIEPDETEIGVNETILGDVFEISIQTYLSGGAFSDGLVFWKPSAVAAIGELPGFWSINRIGYTDLALYRADSGTYPPITTVDTDATDVSGQTVNQYPTWFMSKSTDGAFAGYCCSKRVSFMAIHEGLTQSEATDFYLAIQNLRMALGGGFV